MAVRPITSASLMIVGGHPRGRRPRAHVRATERIEFVVTSLERDQLKQLAADEGKPLAAVIRQAVDEFVADYRDKLIFGHSFR